MYASYQPNFSSSSTSVKEVIVQPTNAGNNLRNNHAKALPHVLLLATQVLVICMDASAPGAQIPVGGVGMVNASTDQHGAFLNSWVYI